MIKKVMEAVNKYLDIQGEANETWRTTKEKLIENYGEGSRAYREGYDKAKSTYESTVETAKKEAVKSITEAFDEATEAIRNHILVPVPDDFPTTLEMIKIIGSGITVNEIKPYLDKYRGNYLANRALISATEKYTKESFTEILNDKYNGINIVLFIPYDHVLNQIEWNRNNVMDAFVSEASALGLALIVDERHNNPLIRLNHLIDAFLTGNYENIEPVKEIDGGGISDAFGAMIQ